MLIYLYGLALLLLHGSDGHDLVSLFYPADYFKSRNIPISVGKMTELATRKPVDAKSEIGQLLALRWLAENAAEVKKAKDFPMLLRDIEEVAKGKKAQDPLGFAAEYASKTAAALGSPMKPLGFALPDNSLRQDAVSWFPKDASFIVGVDLRSDSPPPTPWFEPTRKKFLIGSGPKESEGLYDMAESAGNVRIVRIAIAAPEDAKTGVLQLYVRMTGKMNHDRLVTLMKNDPNGGQVKQEKDFRGVPIAIRSSAIGNIPTLALVGDHDFLVIAPFPENALPDDKALLRMLDVRRGKDQSVLDGALAKQLNKVSPQAAALVLGKIPTLPAPKKKGQVAPEPQAPKPEMMPTSLFIDAVQIKNHYQSRIIVELSTVKEAKKLTSALRSWQWHSLTESFDMMLGGQRWHLLDPNNAEEKKELHQHFVKNADLFWSMNVECEENRVGINLKVPAELIAGLQFYPSNFVDFLEHPPMPIKTKTVTPK